MQLGLMPGASDRAETFLADHPSTRERFDRVVQLIQGFETTFGMELLATVHRVAKHEGAASPGEAVTMTYAWNRRKRMFGEDHIRMAWDALTGGGWVKLAATGVR